MKSGRKKKNNDLKDVENPLDLIDDDDIPLLAKSIAELIRAKRNNLPSSPTQNLNEDH